MVIAPRTPDPTDSSLISPPASALRAVRWDPGPYVRHATLRPTAMVQADPDAAPLPRRSTQRLMNPTERTPRPAPARLAPTERSPEGRRLGRPSIDPLASTLDCASTEVSCPVPVWMSPRTSAGYTPGTVLCGRYELIEPLGKGGMGTVWRARSMGLDIEVAVKLVRRSAGVPNAGERLLREARVTARIRHSAAVRVLDFHHTDAGDPFLVMELLAGRSLSQTLTDEGPLAPIAAVELLLPVIDALDAAHREGIVHRDVKPANVMLVKSGRRLVPKLIDFGIAGVAPSAWSSKLASYGMLLGSPAYMAPEQARGVVEVEPRTDVWGICMVLYEAVTGERPFHGANRNALTQDILLTRVRRPEALAAHPRLWEIIEMGLAKAPEERWPTMKVLRAALAAWAREHGAICDATGVTLLDQRSAMDAHA